MNNQVTANEPVIEFRNVSKTYTLYRSSKEQFISLFYRSKKLKKHQALKNVSFTINKGESIGIVGNNGAGKSTMLKMITGVSFPTEGEVVVHGRVSALLELTAGFSDEMTGRENIYLKGLILGLEQEQIKEIEPDIVAFAELGDYIDQPVRTYSSGMKMRLGFAININTRPEILVIDEALSVGDAKFQQKCQAKIKELIASGVTVMFVSHSAGSVRDVCTRALYLKKGQLMYDGDVETAIGLHKENK